MYVRATPRKNKDGSTVRYLQLAHNVWDPVAKRSRAQVIYNFGRADAASRAAIERLVASLSRFLDPEAAWATSAGEGFDFLESRALGGSYVLDGLWRRLGIDALLRRLLRGRRRAAAAERVLFVSAACCASMRSRLRPRSVSTAPTCCAAATPSSPPMRSPSATSSSGRSSAPGAT